MLQKILTENLQGDLQGVFSSIVLGYTAVDALIGQGDMLDPEGAAVLHPDRMTVVEPADLRTGLSLDYAGQSHSLAQQGFQQGRTRQDPGLSCRGKHRTPSQMTDLTTLFVIHSFPWRLDVFITEAIEHDTVVVKDLV